MQSRVFIQRKGITGLQTHKRLERGAGAGTHDLALQRRDQGGISGRPRQRGQAGEQDGQPGARKIVHFYVHDHSLKN